MKTMEEAIYCEYLNRYVDEGLCYDIQMISAGLILPCALPRIEIDKTRAKRACSGCQHRVHGAQESR